MATKKEVKPAAPKKVTLRLVGLDGNAFNFMGAFQHQALKEGWGKEEIKAVLDECQSGDYDHLLATLAKYCNDVPSVDGFSDPDDDDPWEDEEEDDDD
jgi:hypothetical protein